MGFCLKIKKYRSITGVTRTHFKVECKRSRS